MTMKTMMMTTIVHGDRTKELPPEGVVAALLVAALLVGEDQDLQVEEAKWFLTLTEDNRLLLLREV